MLLDKRLIAFLWLLAVGVTLPIRLTAGPLARPLNGPRATPVVRAVQKVMPSVVNISTDRIVRVSDPFDAFFNEFFSGHFRYFKKSIPLGSGIIVDPTGLVVTNYHVVKRASAPMVKLWDGRVFKAFLVAYDTPNDLALLQLDGDFRATPLTAIDFALPDDLFLGETVVTVGNPFGLEHSVAAGVLSAKNRSLRENGVTFNDILQTDAAINPGNSGGPLINLDGALIGLNLAIRRDAEGIGFAIPLRRIEEVLTHWLIPSRFSVAVCGFIPATVLDAGKPEVVVKNVSPETPAAAAGLREGDVITHVNGKPVSRALTVGRALWALTPGQTVQLQLADEKTIDIKIAVMTSAALVRRRLGIQLQSLTKPLLRALELPATLRGLAISEVLPDSEFASRQIRRGDIVIRIGETDTRTVEDAYTALKDKRPGTSLPVFLIAVENIRNQVFLRRFGVNVTLK